MESIVVVMILIGTAGKVCSWLSLGTVVVAIVELLFLVVSSIVALILVRPFLLFFRV